MSDLNHFIEEFKRQNQDLASDFSIRIAHSLENIPPLLFQIASTVGWNGIVSTIQQHSSEIEYSEAGLSLAAFAISAVNGDNESSIPEVVLNLGKECLKSLSHLNIDRNNNLTYSQKEADKRLADAFLDFWKDWLKKDLKQEGRLL